MAIDTTTQALSIAQLLYAVALSILAACFPCIPLGRTKCCCGCGAVLSVIWITICIILVVGVFMFMKNLIIPWIVFTSIVASINLILVIFYIFKIVKGEHVCKAVITVIINGATIVFHIVCLYFISVLYVCLNNASDETKDKCKEA